MKLALWLVPSWALQHAGVSGPPGQRRRVQKNFINLTNGLEALDVLEFDGFVRIQSSHCEARDFYGILTNLDHNLLMHLALGATCCIYDFGSRGSKWPDPQDPSSFVDGVKIPRALWWGVEWARYSLSKVWKVDAPTPILRGYTATTLFDTKINRIPKPLHKRLKYYRKFHPSFVDLRGIYFRPGTIHDGDDAFYFQLAQRYFLSDNETCDDRQDQNDDLILPPDYVEYRSSDYANVGRAAKA